MFKRQLKQHSIQQFDFQDLELSKEGLQRFRDRSLAYLPQMLAFLGREVKLVRNDNGLFSFDKTLKNLGKDLREQKLLLEGEPVEEGWMLGLLRVLNHKPRGEILSTSTKQSSPEGSRYAANVPLVLSAFKQYRDVKYEDWDWSEDPKAIKWFTDEDILEVVKYRGVEVNWTHSELLNFREQTNPQGKAPTQITTVTRVQDPDFKKLPRLVKLLILQLWVYHPQVRHELAICSLENFDEHQQPLVDAHLGWQHTAAKEVRNSLGSKVQQTVEVPW